MRSKLFSRIAVFSFIFCFAFVSNSLAQVEVKVGPTPIPGGTAVANDDITLSNDLLAVSIAVGTIPPWGMPRGGILDAAPVKGGKIEMDRVTWMDFTGDKWSEWDDTSAEISVVKDTDEEAVIRVQRKWREATVDSTYTLKDGEDRVFLKTVMTNTGKEDMTDLMTGYLQWPNSGALKEPVGAEGVTWGAVPLTKPGTNHTVAYDETWALALYAPFATHVDYHGRDMYMKHTLKPEESLVVESWMQVLPSGDISSALVAEALFEGKKVGKLKGTVTSSGSDVVKVPAIVAESGGKKYTWALGKDGKYEITLPVGEYELYAAARNYSPSLKQKVIIKEGENEDVNFSGLSLPGTMIIKVKDQNGNPLAGRLTIKEGTTQPIVFLGINTLFTEINPVGEIEEFLAPGDYVFSATHGAYFLAPPVEMDIKIESGKKVTKDLIIDLGVLPESKGWYNADLHHHSNILDADTDPEHLVRSQVAAGVDFTFISDHDSSGNHEPINKFSKEAGLAFIPGLEISPSWAHFNIYPLALGVELDVDADTATVDEIFESSRRVGAKVIAVNHPTYAYGYFTSLDAGVIPGGNFNTTFDLMEINSTIDIDVDLLRYWELWNQGLKKYLTGGTDNHNVWKGGISADMRAVVKVEGEPTIDNFIDALLAGRSFITQGPIIYPEIMFGSEIPAGKDVKFNFDIESVMGLSKAVLIGNGKEVMTKEFTAAPKTAEVSFEVKAPEAGQWYSLTVYDKDGLRAWGNPVWVE